jgi:hypothetical protein
MCPMSLCVLKIYVPMCFQSVTSFCVEMKHPPKISFSKLIAVVNTILLIPYCCLNSGKLLTNPGIPFALVTRR